MKNLHLIPTDKPSKLYKHNELGFKLLAPVQHEIGAYKGSNQHIYITSDEEIKEGDWILKCKNVNDWNFKSGELQEKDYSYFKVKCISLVLLNPEDKKIILTTDQDLIKDGVQSIDDGFLKWFVKNPSCEEVKIEALNIGNGKLGYVICKPESKQIKCYCGHTTYCDCEPIEERKQETLEEAAKDYIENTMKFSFNSLETKTQANRMLKCVEFGAKWQSERMYSEEDMNKSFFQGWVTRERFDDQIPDIIYPQGLDYEEKQEYAFNLWFEQFKKK